jgi:predicted nucleic acid-binding protein
MMPVEPGILDANVLAYAVNADAPQPAASRALLEAASDPSITLYVTLRRRYCASFIRSSPTRAVAGWMQLLRRHPVTGGDVFDLQIVATMQANGIQRIYTFNGADFEVFSELAVVAP